jgi:DNA-entry nuclease
LKKRLKHHFIHLIIGLFILSVGAVWTNQKTIQTLITERETNNKQANFKPSYLFETQTLDNLRRATQAHIVLQFQDMATSQKRPSHINYDPVGWHNYKFKLPNSSKKAWLFDRGHLVGYQFCHENDLATNLVPETKWLNAGNYNGMADTNSESMLFYENKLADWLKTYPDKWLDYQVSAIYRKNELIPRHIKLIYKG